MDNKRKAAELIMAFLPVVGQDPYTGITTAKECAKVTVNEIKKADLYHPFDQVHWDEVLKHIDSF